MRLTHGRGKKSIAPVPVKDAHVRDTLAVGIVVVTLKTDFFKAIRHRLNRFDQEHIDAFGATLRGILLGANPFVKCGAKVRETGWLESATGPGRNAQRSLDQQSGRAMEGSETECHKCILLSSDCGFGFDCQSSEDARLSHGNQ
jgi:hypothetical protein